MGHDGDQGAHKEHITENGNDRRDQSQENPLIIAQIPWIRESQKRPPYGLPHALETGRQGIGKDSGNEQNQDDEDGDQEQLIRGALQ